MDRILSRTVTSRNGEGFKGRDWKAPAPGTATPSRARLPSHAQPPQTSSPIDPMGYQTYQPPTSTLLFSTSPSFLSLSIPESARHSNIIIIYPRFSPATELPPHVDMAIDPLSPIAPARIRALLLPVGRIKRSRFMTFVDLLQPQCLVRLGDISPDPRPDRSMISPICIKPNSCI